MNKHKGIAPITGPMPLHFPEAASGHQYSSRRISSGMGIGSYVYLRRIFERIIVTASHKAISDGKIKAEDFGGARVNEKIKMLSDYLPKSLVHNEAFYGIVSKGIHELSEEECIEYFPIMKSFIMMILRQWEKMRKDEEEEKQLSVALGSIAAKIMSFLLQQ